MDEFTVFLFRNTISQSGAEKREAICLRSIRFQHLLLPLSPGGHAPSSETTIHGLSGSIGEMTGLASGCRVSLWLQPLGTLGFPSEFGSMVIVITSEVSIHVCLSQPQVLVQATATCHCITESHCSLG